MASILSGVVMGLVFPKAGLWPLAWVGMIPLLAALRGAVPGRGFVLGFLFGVGQGLPVMYWLVWTVSVEAGFPLAIGLLGTFALVAALAAYTGLFGWGLVLTARRGRLPSWLAAPLLWLAIEWLRGWAFTGLPWTDLGTSQLPWLALVQLADLGGTVLVSALVVLVNAALLELGRRRWMPPAVAAVAMGLALLYGHIRIAQLESALATVPWLRAAVAQGNVPQALKWEEGQQKPAVAAHRKLSERAVAKGAQLVVWPENAMPFVLGTDERLSPLVWETSEALAVHLLAGGPGLEIVDGEQRRTNRAWLVAPGGQVAGHYDKTHLVPFGEYTPFRRHLPFLRDRPRPQHAFDPGTGLRTLPLRSAGLEVDIGPLVCFESIFPDMARALVDDGAGLLAVLTNDAWFGTTSAPYQHFDLAVMRAIETRRSLVHAANTGISGLVEPTGRVVARTAMVERAAIVADLPVLELRSVYVRGGHSLGFFCSLMVLLLLAPPTRRREP